ncbi:activated Cdc42 kinase-like isoform X2 [Halyomorpha halys]|uniref:activated Cdc42 kinase-like isoform X2 n=1 Tax=Halyomorpha halys TaxID=286706 RepID=UPI0006D51183|nr:tyrosine-protein kinase PR2 isoform X1 [Halyomorpha halys]XP_014281277.1 tyrosine-protein kinase PR2 isoform X1 [Halyomorpha halys]
MTSKGPGLYEFLIEAELQQYFAGFKNDLKVQNVAQLKYVCDEDLQQLGMSKPEMRRLKKYFQKHFPQTYLSKFKKMIMPRKEEAWEANLPSEVPERPPVRVPNKHIIPADSIIVNKELGTGEFGVVQQGVWTNDGERIQVAIKCLSRERMQNNPIEFLKEAAIMHAIDHEHIVRLYGVVLDTNALMLVTELAALRSLLECLKEPSLRSSFPVLSLCHFAIQICDGMQYLEAKRLIHRDLAARNILVFSKNKVKISDFGLSRALGVGKDYYQTNFNVNLKLPIAWCAPECITYLKFTTASDVWAYAVTLWEMFSYGFQPWAALTGQQILDAVDEPDPQRLERPECCPKEYYSLMLKCWHHDPNKRPKFCEIMKQLPDCKPEQVQSIQDSGDDRLKRDHLVFRVGDIITVLDKSPLQGSALWKGVLNSGKTGLFNPALTVAYLGSNLPSNKPSEFVRGDGKNAYSSKRNRLKPEMISGPQGDMKHTGHVGLDGAYFGDISFLGGNKKYEHVPKQVVAPYKPGTDSEDTGSISTDRAPLLSNITHSNGLSSDWNCGKELSDHEYHEITDDEAVDSPTFQFDFGPSLLDEMDAAFRDYKSPPRPSSPTAHSPPPANDEVINRRNEIQEAANKGKKKLATVKPISSSDEKTLDTAIALTYELANKCMVQQGEVSPAKNKLSFKFPSSSNTLPAPSKHPQTRTEGRTFSDEAQSIPDVQGSLSSEAKAVYSLLVEQPVEANPLRILRNAPLVRPKVRGNKHHVRSNTIGSVGCLNERKLSLPDAPSYSENEEEHVPEKGNAIPLPPRDLARTRTLLAGKPRHERKHPLIIPTSSIAHSIALSQCNPAEPTYLGLEDDPPPEKEAAVTDKPTALKEGEDGFDEQIANEIDLLDDLGEDLSTHV